VKSKHEKKPLPIALPAGVTSITPPLSRTFTDLVRSSPQRRTRVSVSRRVRVDVENDTRHILLVQASTSNTASRSNRATSSNLQVQTLRVQLRTVNVLAAVECDNLMADDIVARRELGWQDGGDLEVVLDERVGDPCSWADDGGLRDLGPFQGAGGEGRAVTCTSINGASMYKIRSRGTYHCKARCS
jgi:hypothetical protein